METSVCRAVNVSASTENRGRKSNFHIGVTPVFSPLVDEFELVGAKENRSFNIHAGRIVIRIANVIRTWPLLGNSAGRSGFELAVFENRKIDVTPVEIGIPNPNALTDRPGIR